jgi:hypothetical protein
MAVMAVKGDSVMKKIMQVVVDQALLDRLEEYRKRQPGIVPSRTRCICSLLDTALRLDELEAVE